MKKYRVLINGENFLFDYEGRPTRMGFYTTRFVEAGGREEAEQVAVAALRREEQLRSCVLNPEDDPPMMYVEEIEEVESLQESRGFAFYVSEASEGDPA